MIEECYLNELRNMEVRDKDDDGKYYKKTIKYLPDSVRITFKSLIILGTCSKSAYIVYTNILTHLNKNAYEVKVDRRILISETELSASAVSKGIKELEEKNLLKITGKDTYLIPISVCYKGNVNTIIQKDEELKKELEIIEKEKEETKRITEFSLKLRNKR